MSKAVQGSFLRLFQPLWLGLMHKWPAHGAFLENFCAVPHGFGKRLFYMAFYRWLKISQVLPRGMVGGLAWVAQLL